MISTRFMRSATGWRCLPTARCWPSERSRNYWRLITRGSGSTSRVRGGALRRRLPKVTKGPQDDGEQEQLSAGGDNSAGAAGRQRHLHRVRSEEHTLALQYIMRN